MAKLYTAVLLSIIILSCKKNTLEITQDSALVDKARYYFESDVLTSMSQDSANSSGLANPLTGKRSVKWNEASIVKFSGHRAVLAPVEYEDSCVMTTDLNPHNLFGMSGITRLLAYWDKNDEFHAEQVITLPDSNYTVDKQYTGLVVFQDWYGKPLRATKYDKNSVVHELAVGQDSAARGILICINYSGYNYSPDVGVYYYWSMPGTCYYFPEGPSGKYNGPGGGDDYRPSGGGGPLINPINTFKIPEGDNVVGNIKDYLKCFDNTPGNDHHYQVTLCVAQPKPGTREPWGIVASGSSSSNPIFVGHTFLVLTERTPNKTITRNVGFYPSKSVWPYSPAATGQYNNDANQAFNISLTINMTSSQFTSLTNYISQTPGLYNLNDRNCTTFALNALNAAGFVLPRTKGTWQGGSGLNPGDLGEDIRGLSLSSNMTRSTVYNSHPNTGECQ